MKKQLAICIVAAGLISMPQSVTAQGFLGKVNKALDNASTKAQIATGQAGQQANGVIVINPVSKAMSVEVVKAIGRSSSENFGDVELVLRVNVKEPVNSIALGGSWGQGKTQAFDADGNVYKMKMPSVSDRYEVTEGLAVKITCSPEGAQEQCQSCHSEDCSQVWRCQWRDDPQERAYRVGPCGGVAHSASQWGYRVKTIII